MVQLFRPATPGFLTTLAATALLAIVSFSVPYFKSIYFLKAAISQSGVAGSVTFGVLGYCLDFNNQITCSKPTVGWEFNPNALLGNDLPIQIPNVVVKWITYALVLHIVALGLAGVSAVFGLLAHIREMSMSCFSSCISGMGAAVCLIAFIFDLVLFFAVRARVNAVQGGSASIGTGLWLTLAAWVLLFFAGCMFSFGRCCISKRPRMSRRRDAEDDDDKHYRENDRLRLDAVKAEADRKREQAMGRQVGSSSFYEQERTPLRREEPQYYEEEVEVMVPYSDSSTNSRRTGSRSTRNTNPGGAVAYQPHRAYEPGAPGTRAVDDYYNNTAPVATEANTYPPQRQPSQNQQTHELQRYRTPSQDGHSHRPQQVQNVPPVPPVPQRYQSPSSDPYQQAYQQPGGYVDPYAQQQQQPQQRAVDPYLAYMDAGPSYGHQAQETSYYTSSSHQQYPSAYAQQQRSPQPAQDPYANATSSYNPQAATMSPPQVTHYQGYDQHNYGYEQQRQDSYGQQGYGHYDPQQMYNAAAQQAYVQPEPVHYQQPAAGYDPYYEQGQGPVRQPTMPRPYDQQQSVLPDEPPRMLVASPRPMDGQSPPYSPAPHAPLAVDTTVVSAVPPTPRGPRSAGPSSQPHAQTTHQWSAGTHESGEAPPQYDPVGPSGTSAYPPEKQR